MSHFDDRLGTWTENDDTLHNAGWVPVAGDIVGRYQIVRELGRGGMGVVFLARDIELRRHVALKILNRPDPQLTRRFKEEAATTARCPHENIVLVYDISEYQGHPYIVLEHIAGQTLRAWMGENGPAIGPGDALSVIIPVVRALVHAHRVGVIHQDLKPENIMVGDDGSIKVLDFGIARIAQSTAPDLATLSASAEIPLFALVASLSKRNGTPPYMSPEQYDAERVDQRSDIWAVGVMLFELLLGRHPLAPFSAPKLAEVRELDIPMPSLAYERPELGALASTVDRCLRKSRSERFHDSRSLLERLEQHATEVGIELTT